MKIWVSLLVALLLSDQLASGYRFLAVIPIPGSSHFVVMEQIMIALAKKGHQVDVVSHFPQKKPIPNYRDLSIAGTTKIAKNSISINETRSFASFSMSKFATMVGDNLCGLLETPVLQELIKNPPKDPPYDAVVIELFGANCYLAFGRHLGVPVIGVSASSLLDWFIEPLGNPLTPAYVPSIYTGCGQYMTFWERLKNTLLINFVTTQMSYHQTRQKEYVKKYFGIELDSMNDLFKDVGLALVNSHHSLHGIRPFSTGIVEVAGVHIGDDIEPLPSDVQKWLDDSKDGCVFFTFGSMVKVETLPDETVKGLYKAFENIAPVRVLMKVANEKDLLPGLPKNVMIKPWFSQKAVLNHTNTKAFLTHGGLMGTLEALHFAVPMVGVPIFGDQESNIKIYVNNKVALTLGSIDNITESSVTSALKTILHDNSYRENIKKLSTLFRDRPTTATETAIYWIEYVAKHGLILQSAAVHLNWFQKNLWDVYGFILLIVILILYVLHISIRWLKKTVCSKICSKMCSKKQSKDTSSKKNK